MKKLVCWILLLSLSVCASGLAESQTYLVDTKDFLYNFNFYAALLKTDHEISVDQADIANMSDGILLKQVYNGCEILSLFLNENSDKVMDLHCTLSTGVPGSTAYMDDFLYLLMEALLACGMEYKSVSDMFTEMGTNNAFEVGDSGEYAAAGLKISYEVTSLMGISFTVEKDRQ